MTMKAQIQNVDIKDATTKQVTALVSYSYLPYGGKTPISSKQEMEFRLDGSRLYIKGRDGRLGYWDTTQEKWYPHNPTKQQYLEEVVQAAVAAALEAIEKEKTRKERLARRSL